MQAEAIRDSPTWRSSCKAVAWAFQHRDRELARLQQGRLLNVRGKSSRWRNLPLVIEDFVDGAWKPRPIAGSKPSTHLVARLKMDEDGTINTDAVLEFDKRPSHPARYKLRDVHNEGIGFLWVIHDRKVPAQYRHEGPLRGCVPHCYHVDVVRIIEGLTRVENTPLPARPEPVPMVAERDQEPAPSSTEDWQAAAGAAEADEQTPVSRDQGPRKRSRVIRPEIPPSPASTFHPFGHVMINWLATGEVQAELHGFPEHAYATVAQGLHHAFGPTTSAATARHDEPPPELPVELVDPSQPLDPAAFATYLGKSCYNRPQSRMQILDALRPGWRKLPADASKTLFDSLSHAIEYPVFHATLQRMHRKFRISRRGRHSYYSAELLP